MPYKIGKNRNQIVMFPELIDDYISEENEVRVIEAFVEVLDMKELGFTRYESATTGRPGYRPQEMLKLYLYGYLNRIRSSRRLEKECIRNVEVMWLLNKLTPDYKTIADFRRDSSQALRQVFREFTVLCREWELFGKEVVAVDGSKFRASNSKKNNYSEKKLTRLLKYINEKINEYLQMLDTTDQEESHERKLTATEIQNRLEKLTKRKSNYEDMEQRIKDSDENEVSTIDADSRLMYSNNNGVDVSYNVQSTVDMKHNLVVDIAVTNNPSDSGQLLPMAERSKEILKVEKITVLADKGYSKSHTDLMSCEKNDITVYAAMQESRTPAGEARYKADNFTYLAQTDIYICPEGKKLSFWRTRKVNDLEYREYANFKECKSCPAKGKCTKAEKGRTISRSEATGTIEAIKKRMEENPQLYKRRQMMNEPVFGTIKRAMGFTYFLTRGFERVKAEASLVFCAYNLRRVINILGPKEIVSRLRTI